MFRMKVWLSWVFLFITRVVFVEATEKYNVLCGACHLLIEELEHQISSVDPKKTVKVGSFRVDPKGNQKLNEIPYGRSEGHIHDILEKICDKSKSYGFARRSETDRLAVVRLETFQGQRKRFSVDVDSSSAAQNRLQRACDEFLEEHEEDLAKFLSKERPNALEQFCHIQLGVCDEEDLMPFPAELETDAEESDEKSDDSEESETDETNEADRADDEL